MKLNHLDLQVSDVQASASFFERAFALTLETNRRSPALAVLSDGHGFVLVLQRKRDAAERYPEGFHLGFLVATVAEVKDAHARLRAAGVELSDLLESGRGVLLYCKGPDGIVVEVSCRARTSGTSGTTASSADE